MFEVTKKGVKKNEVWKFRVQIRVHFRHKKAIKKPKILIIKTLGFQIVVPPGIEPGTHGFSVRCSTN